MSENTQPLTPEQQAEKDRNLEARCKGFNEEVIPLLGKYRVGLGATPFITPDGRIVAKPQLFDDDRTTDEQKPVEAEAKPETPEGGESALTSSQ